jgi:hypothetical protein
MRAWLDRMYHRLPSSSTRIERRQSLSCLYFSLADETPTRYLCRDRARHKPSGSPRINKLETQQSATVGLVVVPATLFEQSREVGATPFALIPADRRPVNIWHSLQDVQDL